MEIEDLKTRNEFLEKEFKKIIEIRDRVKGERNLLKEENEKLQADIEKYENLSEKVVNIETKLQKDAVRQELINKTIVESASKHGAYRADQIPRLFNTKSFVYDSEKKVFQKPITDSNGAIISYQVIDDAVKEFLQDPANDNLIKSKLKLDGMGSGRGSGGTTRKKPIDPELQQAANEKGLSVDDYLEIQNLKNSRLGRC
jgi:hypothetical protein